MATKRYGYNQYKPDGPAGMDIVDAELNRYSPAFDYLSGFVTRSKLKQVDDDRTGTSTSGGTTGGTSTGGVSSTISNQFNPVVNVTGGTQTQQTQAAGGDIVESGQTNTASTTSTPTGSTNTIDTTTGGTTPPPSGGGTTPPPSPTPTPTPDPKPEDPNYNFLNKQYNKYFNRNIDPKGEEYFLGDTGTMTTGADTKEDIPNILQASKEFINRQAVKDEYLKTAGRAATEKEIDAIVALGGEFTDTETTPGTEFLTDYANKLQSETRDDNEIISSAVTADTVKDDLTVGGSLDKTKFDALKAPVQGILGMNLTLGDLDKSMNQITSAYQNVFGRKPDQEGFNYWAKQLKENPNFDLEASFKEQPEYKLRNPGFPQMSLDEIKAML
tara:strand:- start:5306 stop:6460 length:1155 start_codon:yes stop_codon:yes gene_type:complete